MGKKKTNVCSFNNERKFELKCRLGTDKELPLIPILVYYKNAQPSIKGRKPLWIQQGHIDLPNAEITKDVNNKFKFTIKSGKDIRVLEVYKGNRQTKKNDRD